MPKVQEPSATPNIITKDQVLAYMLWKIIRDEAPAPRLYQLEDLFDGELSLLKLAWEKARKKVDEMLAETCDLVDFFNIGLEPEQWLGENFAEEIIFSGEVEEAEEADCHKYFRAHEGLTFNSFSLIADSLLEFPDDSSIPFEQQVKRLFACYNYFSREVASSPSGNVSPVSPSYNVEMVGSPSGNVSPVFLSSNVDLVSNGLKRKEVFPDKNAQALGAAALKTFFEWLQVSTFIKSLEEFLSKNKLAKDQLVNFAKLTEQSLESSRDAEALLTYFSPARNTSITQIQKFLSLFVRGSGITNKNNNFFRQSLQFSSPLVRGLSLLLGNQLLLAVSDEPDVMARYQTYRQSLPAIQSLHQQQSVVKTLRMMRSEARDSQKILLFLKGLISDLLKLVRLGTMEKDLQEARTALLAAALQPAPAGSNEPQENIQLELPGMDLKVSERLAAIEQTLNKIKAFEAVVTQAEKSFVQASKEQAEKDRQRQEMQKEFTSLRKPISNGGIRPVVTNGGSRGATRSSKINTLAPMIEAEQDLPVAGTVSSGLSNDATPLANLVAESMAKITGLAGTVLSTPRPPRKHTNGPVQQQQQQSPMRPSGILA